MSSDSLNSFLDFIWIAAGLYMIFVAVNMKRTGSISNNGMISKGLDLNKAPDPMGYIKLMFPVDLIAGVLFLLCGIASRIGAKLDVYQTVSNVVMVVAVIVIISFGFISIKAQNKYLKP